MKNKLNNLLIISIMLFVFLIVIIIYNKVYKIDTFIIKPVITNPTNPTNPSITKSQPIDRTKLYGALFLENIDKTIKNLSNPDIQYEDSRIQLNNYSDILL